MSEIERLEHAVAAVERLVPAVRIKRRSALRVQIGGYHVERGTEQWLLLQYSFATPLVVDECDDPWDAVAQAASLAVLDLILNQSLSSGNLHDGKEVEASPANSPRPLSGGVS